jgi:phytanoyl-CoA hydroxylase
VTRDEYLHYTANGYHIARGVFSAAEVGEMIVHYMAMSAEGPHPGDSIGVPTRTASDKPDPMVKYPRLINMHNWDKKTKVWMNDMRLTVIAGELLGQKARLIQTMVYFKPAGSRGQSFHQDNLYLRTTPLLGAWVALDKADAENGAMDMVRGSHLYGLLPCQVADTDVSFTDSETVIPQGMEKDLIALEPGDVVFFGGYTIHGSRPNFSPDRFRRAFICHYEGEHALPIVGPPLPKAEAK